MIFNETIEQRQRSLQKIYIYVHLQKKMQLLFSQLSNILFSKDSLRYLYIQTIKSSSSINHSFFVYISRSFRLSSHNSAFMASISMFERLNQRRLSFPPRSMAEWHENRAAERRVGQPRNRIPPMADREEKPDRRRDDTKRRIMSRNSRFIPGLFLSAAATHGATSSETVSLFSPVPGKFRGNDRIVREINRARTLLEGTSREIERWNRCLISSRFLRRFFATCRVKFTLHYIRAERIAGNVSPLVRKLRSLTRSLAKETRKPMMGGKSLITLITIRINDGSRAEVGKLERWQLSG